jgi:hypothetical protein
MLVTYYGAERAGEARYSPAICTGISKQPTIGQPNRQHVSTSYVGRQNLTMRISIRRFTRLTNAFSEKVEKHPHAVALRFMNDNFARVHHTLRVTPAMAAGVTRPRLGHRGDRRAPGLDTWYRHPSRRPTMLSEDDIREQLSIAYIHAVASHAGYA